MSRLHHLVNYEWLHKLFCFIWRCCSLHLWVTVIAGYCVAYSWLIWIRNCKKLKMGDYDGNGGSVMKVEFLWTCIVGCKESKQLQLKYPKFLSMRSLLRLQLDGWKSDQENMVTSTIPKRQFVSSCKNLAYHPQFHPSCMFSMGLSSCNVCSHGTEHNSLESGDVFYAVSLTLSYWDNHILK